MSDNDDTGNLIAYLLVGGVAIAAAKGAWSTKVRPWLDSKWTELADSTNTASVVAGLDRVDLIGLAVLVVPALALIAFLARRSARRRKDAREEAKA